MTAKTITKEKNIIVVYQDREDSDDWEIQFEKLSGEIYDLSRGLYRCVPYESYCINTELPDAIMFQQDDFHTPLQERRADEIWVFNSWCRHLTFGGLRAPAPAIPGTENIHRKFPVMHLAYGIEPLCIFAQRVEWMMHLTYAGYPPAKHAWNKFVRTERSDPNRAACGTPLYPPNGKLADYNFQESILSSCDDWLTYPDLRDRVRWIDSSEWGGTEEGYLRWWLAHLPHGNHKTDGVHDNWWHHVMNFDLLK